MKHILIVDDDKVNMECARLVLGTQYKLSSCASGLQAMQFLATSIPDLILLDINMPFMDGFELIRRIQADERTKNVPLVILTAEKDPEIERKCKEVGALDYIRKPFVPSDLQIRMEQVFLNLERAGFFGEEETVNVDRGSLDPLTGVIDAQHGWQMMDEKIKAGSYGSLLLIGADNLRVVNGFFGMTAGDNLLKALASIIRNYTDAEDVLCRIGGDCFLVYITGVNDKDVIGRRARGIISDMQQKLSEFHMEGTSSVSVGIAIAPEDGDNLPLLYNGTDKALYHVKQNGKNSFHFYSQQTVQSKGGIADLDELYDKLRRTDVEKGAYVLDYYAFQYVFNYLCRQAERGDIRLAALLLNLIPEEGYLPSTAEMERAMNILDQTLFTSLRRSDVSAKYSDRQMLLALPNTGKTELQPVLERVNRDYESKMGGGKVHLQFYVKEIGAAVQQ
ncbi:MAG: diguanylate cyclase [Lachnospiraceae bacterium]|nr:diguanylate cyclase [Lachnospiraceae bacterium]